MSDYIVKATAADNQIRAYAANTRDIVEMARKIHNTSPVATAALGRLLTAGAIMGSMQKGEEDILTLQIKCSGPIGGLVVTADSKANVRGYVHNADVMLPPSAKGKLDVGKALDLGVMNVIKDMGLKEPYVGQTHLVSGEIAEDLTYYFATSEQVPSSVALGVLMNKTNTVRQAGGFIIQLMPFTEEAVISKLEEKLKNMKPITELLDNDYTPEMILEDVLGEFNVSFHEKVSTAYSCNCTKDRVTRAIASVGRKELQDMINEGKDIEVNCHFCKKVYTVTVEELKELAK
ncbi:MAG: Hsp33 family molecular chaperone HslO [Lachnospiraceae bacterium]|nr:Hsp33 family molecular chaperone HslO [Lachnospiraceae bacterium]